MSKDSIVDERDRRYQDRFQAQEHAVEVALKAVREEFHEHLIQYRHEVELAFRNSETAINKSELASEKRFESVNEFRRTLSDQTNTFISRTEAVGISDRNSERINEVNARLTTLAPTMLLRSEYNAAHEQLSDRVNEVNDRLTRIEGRGSGFSQSWGIVVAVIASMAAIFGIYYYSSHVSAAATTTPTPIYVTVPTAAPTAHP